MNKSYLVAILVIVVAVGFAGWALSSSMTPYVTLQIARQSDAPVQVFGKILRDVAGVPNPGYDTEKKALRFWIEDKNKERIEVQFHGAKPEAFDEAPETTATGIIRKDETGRPIFVSDFLNVKCPSKYDDRKSPYSPKPKTTAALPTETLSASATPASAGGSR